jgi:colanic acid biosynthesis glycosyl transferase WcaI
MASILILTLVFPPDNVSTAQIMAELALDLRQAGHFVRVLTTTPHFNDDPRAKQGQPLRNYLGRLIQKSVFNGIPVYHVRMPRKGPSRLVRILAWLGFHLVSTGYGLCLRSRPDVVFAPSPPLTIGVSAWILGCRYHVPFIYNVQEIYPDVAVHLGVLRNRLLIRAMLILEQFVYRKAIALTTISEGMRNRLLSKGVPAEKVHLIPNFVDVTELTPLPKDNDFSRTYGLHEKFVVSYAGNMGKTQGLEVLLQAAHLLNDDTGIHFLLMGDGSERNSLQQLGEALRLRNLTLLPSQPYSVMAQVYGASDLSFVSQAIGTHNDGIPSKVYRIMSCGRAVLAMSDPDSDLAYIVRESGCGAVAKPGDVVALTHVIRNASQSANEWRDRGKKGRAFVMAFNSRTCVNKRYIELIESLTNKRVSHG